MGEMASVREQADTLARDRENLNQRIIDLKDQLGDLEDERHKTTETLIQDKHRLTDLETLAREQVKPLCDGKANDPAADMKYAKIVSQDLRAFGIEVQLLDALARMFAKARDREKLSEFEFKILQTVSSEVDKKLEALKSSVTQSETKLEEAAKGITDAETAPEQYNREMNEKAEEIVLLVQQLQEMQDTHKRDKKKKAKLSDVVLKAKNVEKQTGVRLFRVREALSAIEDLKDWRHVVVKEEAADAEDDAGAEAAAETPEAAEATEENAAAEADDNAAAVADARGGAADGKILEDAGDVD